MFPKDVLNRIRWTGNPTLQGVRVWVLHRGAPGDRRIVDGEEITDLENSFFVVVRRGGTGFGGAQGSEADGVPGLEAVGVQGPAVEGRPGSIHGRNGEWELGKETRIPYHRIQRIYLQEEKIYDRSDFRVDR